MAGVLAKQIQRIDPATPLLWSTWGKRRIGKTSAPMTDKSIWRLRKVYGRMIGYPEVKPHDLRHGVAMEVLEQHHDLEQVRALLGHGRIGTTQNSTRRLPRATEAGGRVLRGESLAFPLATAAELIAHGFAQDLVPSFLTPPARALILTPPNPAPRDHRRHCQAWCLGAGL